MTLFAGRCTGGAVRRVAIRRLVAARLADRLRVVSARVAGQLDRFPAGRRLADHLDVRRGLDQHAEPGAQQGLVVGEHEANGHPAVSASGAGNSPSKNAFS